MFKAFHRPSTRLAGVYLAILMIISLFFSGLVYQLSVQELERGLRRPDPILQQRQFSQLPFELRTQLNDQRTALFEEAKDRILVRLVAINALILITGGFLSYYFAQRTLRPIEEAHESQKQFTADASHELRTPITAMRTENEVALMDSKLTLKEAKLQLQSNIEELEKLSILSEGLLRLAQLEHNKSLPMSEVSLSLIVDQAVERVQASAVQKKITIQHTYSKNVVVYADAMSLVEAVVTILDNAIKYSPHESIVSAEIAVKQKQAEIQISDTGNGIEDSELSKIFDRFYRADTSRSKQKISGYGLGLAIAKNIIDKHNGSIRVNSIVGEGSVFIITLPVKI